MKVLLRGGAGTGGAPALGRACLGLPRNCALRSILQYCRESYGAVRPETVESPNASPLGQSQLAHTQGAYNTMTVCITTSAANTTHSQYNAIYNAIYNPMQCCSMLPNAVAGQGKPNPVEAPPVAAPPWGTLFLFS